MFTLRATRKLLTRLHAEPLPESHGPTTRLGDWYGNLLFRRGGQVVLLVNERSLLPVLMPAAPMVTLLARIPAAVGEIQTELGVPAEVVEAEVAEMAEVRLGATASRRVVGSMTDFAILFDGYRDDGMSLLDVSLRLAEAPCGPIKMRSPRVVARELLLAGE